MSRRRFPDAEPCARHLRARVSAAARDSARQDGFTLIELLVALSLLGILTAAIGSIALDGTSRMADDTFERHLDSTSAQFVSLSFGRDVAGAARLSAAGCGTAADGTALVTFVDSADASLVSYRDVTTTDGHQLLRMRCGTTGAVAESTEIADRLGAAPTVSCGGVACPTSGTPPRTVTLAVTRSARFTFSISASRRTSATTVAAALPAQLFALGGTTPLSVSGNGQLVVVGNTVVNSASATAVSVSGNNARLQVSGSLRILTGGGCSGCNATKVTPFPVGTVAAALPDPLAYLPAPDESQLSTGSCTAGVCRPGIFAARLSITSATTFQPGIYVFRKGLAISGNGAITGSKVLLFNGCGVNAPAGCTSTESTLSISGQAQINVTPMTTGTYARVLAYQSRTNTSAVSISGGSQLMAFSGVLYAPSSSQVSLGAGGGGLKLGAVVGKNLTVTGNGTVQVDGS